MALKPYIKTSGGDSEKGILLKNIRESGRPVSRYGQKILVQKIKQFLKENRVSAEIEIKWASC